MKKAQWILAALAALLLAIAVGYTGWGLLRHGNLPGLAAFTAGCIGGWAVMVNSVRRRFLAECLRAKEAEHRGRAGAAGVDNSGKFAREVDQLLGYYFAKCVPRDTDRGVWLGATAGIRTSLQAEMVDCYQGTRVSSGEVRWLIRHHVYEVRRSWQEGNFSNYRTRFAPQLRVEASFALGCLALAAGSGWAVGLMTVSPAIKAVVVIVGLISGWWASSSWLRVNVDKKKYAVEYADCHLRKAGCSEALMKWKETLEATPSDAEMAAWLDADQKFLMNDAMKHYKLTRSEVIAHAFIAEAVPGCKHHRVPGGPMRYSRYRIHVFLLTSDGVRQVVFNLNFRYGSHPIVRRSNYRFEAIAAVLFTQAPRSLELQLVGGQTINIQLAEPDEDSTPSTDDRAQELDQGSPLGVNLAPASLTNTIHVLEGIAAEGKEWVMRERRHRHARSGSFTSSSSSETWREEDDLSHT
jgi:hypothetical protein